MSFHFDHLHIPEVIRITPTRHRDHRGFFSETYRVSAFQGAGIHDVFLQDNHAYSSRGVLRGLHYQVPPRAQAKLIRVTQGEVFDVAVDLRTGSPTFGCWAGGVLSAKNSAILYIPEGFAHGYQCLSEKSELVYKVSSEFDSRLDGGIVWDDDTVGIPWPLERPILSERDLALPSLAESTSPFKYSSRFV